MKVKDIKRVEIITHTDDEEESYDFTTVYHRLKNSDMFRESFSCTSQTPVCKYCGSWISDNECECYEKNKYNIINENDVVDILKEVLNDDTVMVFINNSKVQ